MNRIRWINLAMISVAIAGCSVYSQGQTASTAAQPSAPEAVPADPAAAEHIPASSELEPEALERLQACVEDLNQPQFLLLAKPSEKPLADWADQPITPSPRYYVAFSALDDLADMRQVESFHTLTLSDSGCQILTPTQTQELANQQLKHHYGDQVALHEGDVTAAWGAIVNRWERDHYVSGPGNHPLVLDIEDIWIARSLNLGLPDYVPIHVQ